MVIHWKITAALAGFLLAAGCVVYPYETAFSSCDGEAGVCYRYCEEYVDTPEYASCHAACEEEANQCFASAYHTYRYNDPQYGAGYSSYPPSTWNGRYGSWYPDYGYRYSYGYYGYGYGPRRPRHPYGYGGRRRPPSSHPPTGGSGGSAQPPAPPPPPPQAQPPQPPTNAGKPPPRRQQPRRTPRTKDNPVRDKD